MTAKTNIPLRMAMALSILASVVVSSDAAAQPRVKTFQALDSNHVFVHGNDGILWFEHDFTGTVPPPRTKIDANTDFYDPFGAVDSNHAYVLWSDSKLWFEHDFTGALPPPRTEVDANVAYFWPIDSTDVCVIGTDGNTWLEHSFLGILPPPRTASSSGDACQPLGGGTPPIPVDIASGCAGCVSTRGVDEYQGISDRQVYVRVGSDLYFETRPFNAVAEREITVNRLSNREDTCLVVC